jgi:hypothetical protein
MRTGLRIVEVACRGFAPHRGALYGSPGRFPFLSRPTLRFEIISLPFPANVSGFVRFSVASLLFCNTLFFMFFWLARRVRYRLTTLPPFMP